MRIEFFSDERGVRVLAELGEVVEGELGDLHGQGGRLVERREDQPQQGQREEEGEQRDQRVERDSADDGGRGHVTDPRSWPRPR
jgi:hypothetical protein